MDEEDEFIFESGAKVLEFKEDEKNQKDKDDNERNDLDNDGLLEKRVGGELKDSFVLVGIVIIILLDDDEGEEEEEKDDAGPDESAEIEIVEQIEEDDEMICHSDIDNE